MRILLIHPPCGPRTMGVRHIARLEPLGLEMIGAAVSAEHDVRLVDMLVRPSDLVRTLKRFTPDVAGVTSEAVRSQQAVEALRTVRKHAPDCLTVAGGYHPTTFPDAFCDPAVDLCVLGEGVETFAEICAARKAGATSFDHIAGLMIRTSSGMTPTEPRPLPTTLDNQPFPDRSLTARYRKHYFYVTEPSAAAMRLSFGCHHSCSFCTSPLYSHSRYVGRDPELMFKEICSIAEPFIYFGDNGSFHEADRMSALAHMLIDRGVKKRFLSYVRTDTIVRNPELFELWARAGMTFAMIGLEALDDDALDGFNKGTSASINEQAVRFLEEIGISILAGFVVEPTAGPADFERLDTYIKAHPAILHAELTPLTPFPGTRYHRQHGHNVIARDWDLYDMQHFVVTTDLPTKKLYRMMLRSYTTVVLRVIRREKLWLPFLGIRTRKLRLLRGLLASRAALRRAHTHVQSN